MNKTELLAEKRKTEHYLNDLKQSIPSALLDNNNDFKIATEHLDKLNDQLLKIEKVESKRKTEQDKKKKAEEKILDDTLQRVYELREHINAQKVGGSVKGKLASISMSLNEGLRGFTPVEKSA